MPDIARRYIVLDNNFTYNLNRADIQVVDDADRNASKDNHDKDMLRHFFRQRLDIKPSLLKRVQMTYARDYELIRNA
jgi:hypothetical protein